MSDLTPALVSILGKEYRVACEPEQEEELRSAARLLDNKMREIKAGGKVIGTDRIAVMAALNMAHELLGAPADAPVDSASSASKRVRGLRERVELALNDTNQLEL